MSAIKRVSDLGTRGVVNIADGIVVASDIANNSITQEKLSTDVPLGGFRNKVINGDMRINQRGNNSMTVSGGYTADKWQMYTGNSAFTMYYSTDAPAGFRNSVYAQCTNALGNASYNGILHCIEGYNIADAGFGTAWARPITVSFWVKSTKTGVANFSFANSNNSRTYVTEYTIDAANTWEYKYLTINADTTNTGWDTTNGMGLRLWWDLGSSQATYDATANTWTGADKIRTAGATLNITSTLNSQLFISGVQVEIGSQPTPFERRSIGPELALCQRYYETSNGVTSVAGGTTGFGGNSYWNWVSYKVEKRISIGLTTSAYGNGIRVFATDGGADYITMWKAATQYYSIAEGTEICTTQGFAIVTYSGQTDAGLARFYWNAHADF